MKSIVHQMHVSQISSNLLAALESNKLPGLYIITSRNYCEKSIYQRHEEEAKEKKVRTVYGEPYPEWRKPWIKRDGEWSSKLNIFVEKNPSPQIMNALQKLPDLNWKQIKEWWADMRVIQEIHNQKYMPERVAALGSNLAAVHFFTYRLAAVRLKNSREWIQGDITTLNLPNKFEEGYFVEAVDCTSFHHNGIRYEGIQNLANLNFLKWLSLKNNRHVDVWCLDRLAGQNGASLQYLDISGCRLCVGCIFALARMSALEALVISDPGDNVPVQAALSMLEQERPKLMIRTVQDESVPNVDAKLEVPKLSSV